MLQLTFALRANAVHHVIGALLVLLSLAGCQSLKDDSKQANDELATQRALIASHLNRGMPTHALRELRPLLQKHPNDPELLSLMGLVHLAMRAPHRAITFLERSYELSPSPTTALNLSSAYIEHNQLAKALRLLQDAEKKGLLQGYEYPERIYHNMGLALEKAERTAQAVRYYRKALDENPDFYLTLMQFAALHEGQGRDRQARELYRRARASCLRCVEPVTAMARSYVKSGKPEAAQHLANSFVRQRDLDQNTRQTAIQELAKVLRDGRVAQPTPQQRDQNRQQQR